MWPTRQSQVLGVEFHASTFTTGRHCVRRTLLSAAVLFIVWGGRIRPSKPMGGT